MKPKQHRRGVPLLAIAGRLRNFYRSLRKENLPRLILFALLIVVVGGSVIFIVESRRNREMFNRFFDGLWWTVVTMTSVGYGDKVPVTTIGRIFAIVIMMTGVVVTSILSGTIASIFVDKKIREGKGLQEINFKNHIVICGWNRNAESILTGLSRLSLKTALGVVLINEMDPEDFQVIELRYPDLDLRFIRGDFTNEIVLRRGSLSAARAAIILADSSGSNTLANADERTILSTLAIKSLNSDITTSAELVNPENAQHLRRADVDDILVNGEFNGFLFATSTFSKGIPKLVKEILSFDGRNSIRLLPIPPAFVGKTFAELLEHFLESGRGILVGLLAEEKGIAFEDLISDDTSAIDVFIKRKFAEASIDIGEEEQKKEQVMVNPAPGYVVTENESAFVIGSTRPGAA